jgi:hypothetical protein
METEGVTAYEVVAKSSPLRVEIYPCNPVEANELLMVKHADHAARILALEAENTALVRKVERLMVPVSDEEWLRNSFQVEADMIGKIAAERVDFDDIIAARAAEKVEDNG